MSASPDAVMRRWFQEVWNERREQTIDELMAPGAKVHGLAGGVIDGPAGFKPFYRAFCDAFGDFKVDVVQTVVEGDRVAALCHVTGRHVGDALGGKATGRADRSLGHDHRPRSRRQDRRGLEHVRFPDDVSADRVGEVAGGGGVRTVVALALLAAWPAAPATAADQWIEVKSAHFTVVSNASERTTSRLVWQLEQVRSAMTTLFRGRRPSSNRPLDLIVAKDENSMRVLVPHTWEERRAVRPASVWVGGPDATYIVLRADVEVEEPAGPSTRT